MERNAPAKLRPLTELGGELPYGLRFDYADPALEASLEKRGVLFPLWAKREGEKLVLVAGHKRFLYARRKKWKEVPVTLLDEDISPQGLYLLSVYSNWNQNWPDLDRMTTLQKGEEAFGFTSQALCAEVLPALGLTPGRRVLEDYRKAAGLPAEIHKLIHAGRVPFRGAPSLARFPDTELALLAEAVFGRIHLTSSQLTLASEWLCDLKKIRREGVAEILKEIKIQNILEHPRMDFRAKGDRFFARVRRLRFPRLSAEEKNFQTLI